MDDDGEAIESLDEVEQWMSDQGMDDNFFGSDHPDSIRILGVAIAETKSVVELSDLNSEIAYGEREFFRILEGYGFQGKPKLYLVQYAAS